jgi:hypothetical protein
VGFLAASLHNSFVRPAMHVCLRLDGPGTSRLLHCLLKSSFACKIIAELQRNPLFSRELQFFLKNNLHTLLLLHHSFSLAFDIFRSHFFRSSALHMSSNFWPQSLTELFCLINFIHPPSQQVSIHCTTFL